MNSPHTRWVEVNINALKTNAGALRRRMKPGCRLIAVVKANGYGHGLTLAARAFAEAGAEMLAVTTLEEGIELRSAGIEAPILLLAPSLTDESDALLEHDFTATLCDTSQAIALSRAARGQGKRLRVHLKIDTGMGRVGALWTDATLLAEACRDDPGLDVEGVYTHFATAFQPSGPLFQRQRDAFLTVLDILEASGIRPPLAHACNSAAFLNAPDLHLDAVRLGTVLYGQIPPGAKAYGLQLEETWKLCCRIAQVKELPKGWTVGYGAEYRCERATRVAVLPVGYADGLAVEPGSVFKGKRGLRRWIGESLLKRNPPYAIIRGQRAPFIGRVAAQMVCADVTGIPEAQAGDVARLFARRTLVNADVPRIQAIGAGVQGAEG